MKSINEFRKNCVMMKGLCVQTSDIQLCCRIYVCIYLGQTISFEGYYIDEIENRIKKACMAYWSLKHIFKSHMSIKKAVDSVVTPTLLHGCLSCVAYYQRQLKNCCRKRSKNKE